MVTIDDEPEVLQPNNMPRHRKRTPFVRVRITLLLFAITAAVWAIAFLICAAL